MKQETSFDGSELVNIIESYVIDYINSNLKTFTFCTCQICLNDIAALAITQLPVMYVTNIIDFNMATEKLDKLLIDKKINTAITMVKSRPHH